MLLDLLTLAVFAYVGANLLGGLRAGARSSVMRRRVVKLVRGLRLRHFLLGPPALAGVVVAFALLYQVPPLRFGWWTAIGGLGNIVFGSTSRTRGTPLEWVIPAAFALMLVPLLPLLVEREEMRFRVGAEGWSFGQRVMRGVQFGLLHLVAGIPIAAALAISIAGWWLTWMYLRGYRQGGARAALDESARVHLAYDLEVIALVVVALALA